MVSFIILNYNSSELAKNCVDSIDKYVTLPYEIIVVDNASRIHDYDNLKKILPQSVQIVRSRVNGGFGAGNMLGANFAKGEYLCFLNSDVELVEDCVTPLCEYIINHPEVGCITPCQCNGEGKKVHSFAHATGIMHEVLKDKIFEKIMPDSHPNRMNLTEPTVVDHINGCFMLFTAETFWEIGGFDTNIFLYCEEDDISRRLRNIGKECVYNPLYKFVHFGAVTTKKEPKAFVRKELYVSRIYVYNKYHNILLSILFRFVLLIKVLVNPNKWSMIDSVVRGEALSTSMKHRCRKVRK